MTGFSHIEFARMPHGIVAICFVLPLFHLGRYKTARTNKNHQNKLLHMLICKHKTSKKMSKFLQSLAAPLVLYI